MKKILLNGAIDIALLIGIASTSYGLAGCNQAKAIAPKPEFVWVVLGESCRQLDSPKRESCQEALKLAETYCRGCSE